MKERGIIFSKPMVHALLAGVKTQTRRAVKITHRTPGLAACLTPPVGAPRPGTAAELCPYGQPGDRLWVRETFSDIYGAGHDEKRRKQEVMYRANGETDPYVIGYRWTPSIHMPRWASRIVLEIVAVRAERLNDCSEADAIAEGCTKNHNGYYWGGPHPETGTKQMATACKAYRDLWESINGAGSWAANPWVWVIEFKVMK